MDADYSAGFLVDLQHYRGGPTFKVMCNDIIAAGEDDLRLCAKTTDGWRFTRTCPTIVLRAGNMEEYMLKNIEQCLRAAEGTWMHSLLCKVDRNDPLVSKALLLWTATHLLMRGWQIEGESPILDKSDPFYNTSPASKILQRQLDAIMEVHVMILESSFLELLHNTLRHSQKRGPRETMAAALIYLNTIEMDTWRLLYWLYFKQEVG